MIIKNPLIVSVGGGNTTTLKGYLDSVKTAKDLFRKYNGTSVDGLIVYDDTENVTKMNGMFAYCRKITTIPLLNTSKVTDMNGMFDTCEQLTTIPALNVSNVDDFYTAFFGCSRLKSILMTGMKVEFDISTSTKFERTDLVTILNNLATITSTQTLTMGTNNLAKLTDEDKAIATNKGWTLA